ncbi:MAG: DUF1275 domain-containing protein [Clostridiaceae bacterium]|jgi:uncharacterized membrane protein YoaK (UPF0700 family)|nr:DUF1275 domain-containing protein [Clostridiaceae bacterium]
MRKLSRKNASLWVSLMTFSAGFINAETLLGPAFTSSHHTGNLTQLAAALKNGRWTLALTYLGMIVAFFMGSTIAGMLFYQCEIGHSKRYGYFLLMSGTLYALMSFTLPSELLLIPCFFAALSLGIQNGILLNYHGVTTRTTHMTGYLTDAGIELGKRLRGAQTERWKLPYLTLHILIYVVGSVVGALTRHTLFCYTITVAGAIQIVCGIIYFAIVIPEHKRNHAGDGT